LEASYSEIEVILVTGAGELVLIESANVASGAVEGFKATFLRFWRRTPPWHAAGHVLPDRPVVFELVGRDDLQIGKNAGNENAARSFLRRVGAAAGARLAPNQHMETRATHAYNATRSL
jgi:hypothetical protein